MICLVGDLGFIIMCALNGYFTARRQAADPGHILLQTQLGNRGPDHKVLAEPEHRPSFRRSSVDRCRGRESQGMPGKNERKLNFPITAQIIPNLYSPRDHHPFLAIN